MYTETKENLKDIEFYSRKILSVYFNEEQIDYSVNNLIVDIENYIRNFDIFIDEDKLKNEIEMLVLDFEDYSNLLDVSSDKKYIQTSKRISKLTDLIINCILVNNKIEIGNINTDTISVEIIEKVLKDIEDFKAKKEMKFLFDDEDELNLDDLNLDEDLNLDDEDLELEDEYLELEEENVLNLDFQEITSFKQHQSFLEALVSSDFNKSDLKVLLYFIKNNHTTKTDEEICIKSGIPYSVFAKSYKAFKLKNILKEENEDEDGKRKISLVNHEKWK